MRLVGSDLHQFCTYHPTDVQPPWQTSFPCSKHNSKTTTLTFSCWKRVRILISLRVRWQYVWCSKGRIFLMATFMLFWVSVAELVECKHGHNSHKPDTPTTLWIKLTIPSHRPPLQCRPDHSSEDQRQKPAPEQSRAVVWLTYVPLCSVPSWAIWKLLIVACSFLGESTAPRPIASRCPVSSRSTGAPNMRFLYGAQVQILNRATELSHSSVSRIWNDRKCFASMRPGRFQRAPYVACTCSMRSRM